MKAKIGISHVLLQLVCQRTIVIVDVSENFFAIDSR